MSDDDTENTLAQFYAGVFDEDEEVVYWLSEYSTYLRGLKNRISNDYSQPNYLAKNNSKVTKPPFSPKLQTPKIIPLEVSKGFSN